MGPSDELLRGPELELHQMQMIDLLARKGLEHENRFKTSLETQGLKLFEIPHPDRTLESLQDAAGRTEEAMREGQAKVEVHQ